MVGRRNLSAQQLPGRARGPVSGHGLYAAAMVPSRMERPPFTRWETSELGSLAALAPEGHRCGVYVLEFNDGTRYVGQASDVVRRYATHRRAHLRAGRSIQAVEFAEVAPADLNRVERFMIAHEEQLGPISNNRHTSQFNGPSLLDPIITVDEQLAWLNGPSDDKGIDLETARRDDPVQRAKGQQRYQQLLSHPLGELACEILRDFVSATVPHPRQTERQFWAMSAMPFGGARMATLSVGNMELLFLYVEPGPVEEFGQTFAFGGLINVAASQVAPDVLAGALDNDWAYRDDGNGYESAGADWGAFRFFIDADRDGYDELLSWPGVADGARTLALRQMRKGTTLQGRWHNYPLADVLLGDTQWPWPGERST